MSSFIDELRIFIYHSRN